jgi:hypothetical protein
MGICPLNPSMLFREIRKLMPYLGLSFTPSFRATTVHVAAAVLNLVECVEETKGQRAKGFRVYGLAPNCSIPF